MPGGNNAGTRLQFPYQCVPVTWCHVPTLQHCHCKLTVDRPAATSNIDIPCTICDLYCSGIPCSLFLCLVQQTIEFPVLTQLNTPITETADRITVRTGCSGCSCCVTSVAVADFVSEFQVYFKTIFESLRSDRATPADAVPRLYNYHLNNAVF